MHGGFDKTTAATTIIRGTATTTAIYTRPSLVYNDAVACNVCFWRITIINSECGGFSTSDSPTEELTLIATLYFEYRDSRFEIPDVTCEP
ncbi:MAG: hypothetical protein JRI92_07760 [Deltaproteobacteria bacterium]|nr:hypothetical protein [Deltaproteobacteria bacterium]